MSYVIKEARSSSEVRKFVEFPDILYKGCPQYVPMLHRDEVYLLTKVSTLSYCSRKMWLVTEGSKVVGRICAIVNPRYNEIYKVRRAMFSWFDCINSLEVARLLFDAAEAWVRDQGMTEVIGPMSYNSLGKAGMLVEGYENIPPFNCLYNFPYYNDLVLSLGYQKDYDCVQYIMVANHGVPEKTRRVANVVAEKYNLHFGSIDRIKRDPMRFRKFLKAYNESFSSTVTNYVPFTDAEIDEQIKAFAYLISDKSSCILEDEAGDFVAFGISYPTLSTALQKARGHWFPFGWYHIRKALRKFHTVDLMANGAVEDWQNKGVSALYYREMADKAIKTGTRWAISYPQVESDSAVNIWNNYEHDPYMRRRCYIKTL